MLVFLILFLVSTSLEQGKIHRECESVSACLVNIGRIIFSFILIRTAGNKFFVFKLIIIRRQNTVCLINYTRTIKFLQGWIQKQLYQFKSNYFPLLLNTCTLIGRYVPFAMTALNLIRTRSKGKAKCDILFSNILEKNFLLRDFSNTFRLRLDICTHFFQRWFLLRRITLIRA
jgi:hypothetical protein